MANAKEEFLGHVRDREVLCANMLHQDYMHEHSSKGLELPVNYTQEQYDEFINSLDFDYDNGYGGQELFGTVWFKDGTWADRGEYDGSEWWEHHVCPQIPERLSSDEK